MPDDTATAPPPPMDAELKALQLAQAKVEAQQKILEAQKATIAAQLPASDVKPLAGDTALGANVGLVADLVAHSMLGPAASRIWREIEKEVTKASSVLIVEDRGLMASDWPYIAIKQQLDREIDYLTGLNDGLTAAEEFEFVIEPPLGPSPDEDEEAFIVFSQGQAEVLNRYVGEQISVSPGVEVAAAPVAAAIAAAATIPALGPVAAVPAVLNATAGIAGMLRSDWGVTARTVTVGSSPLVSAVAKRLLDAEIANVGVDGFQLATTEVGTQFNRLSNESVGVADRVLKIKQKFAQADRKLTELTLVNQAYLDALKATAAVGGLPTLAEWSNRIETQVIRAEESIAPHRATVAAAEAAVARATALTTALTAGPASGPVPVLAAAAREALHNGKFTHVLYVAIESAAGETITRKHLFMPTKVRFVGGMQVTYLLLNVADNRLAGAGSAPALASLRMGLDDFDSDTLAEIRSVRLRDPAPPD